MPMLVFIDQSKVQEILNGDKAVAYLLKGVVSATEQAKIGTPELTGEHRENIVGYLTTDEDGNTIGHVGSLLHTWHLIEFGSYHNNPSRSMTHGVEAAGIKFTAAPKP